MTEYFISFDGGNSKKGPFDFDFVKNMIATNRIQPSAQYLSSDDQVWKSISQFGLHDNGPFKMTHKMGLSRQTISRLRELLNLHEILNTGKTTSTNLTPSIKLLNDASRQCMPGAQFMLAQHYDQGEGVPQDFAEAYVWYSLSSTFGHSDGRRLRDLAASKITQITLEKAQERARKIYDQINVNNQKQICFSILSRWKNELI